MGRYTVLCPSLLTLSVEGLLSSGMTYRVIYPVLLVVMIPEHFLHLSYVFIILNQSPISQ